MQRILLPAVCALVIALPARAAPSSDAANSENEFAFALLDELSAEPGNLVFSPFSIWSALAMTSAGAEGETLKQMRNTLHLPEEDAQAHALAGDWAKELTGLKSVELNVANRLWGEKGLPFEPEFLKLTEVHYKAGLETVDFKKDANAARLRINDWVAHETKDRIKDLLKMGDVNASTRLVLTNAVYFKGTWLRQFAGDATEDREFTLASQEKINVKTMSAKQAVSYMEDDRMQAVRLPYKGEDTSMIVVLPRKADALKDGAFLNASGFAAVRSALKPEKEVAVQMPRFESRTSTELARALAKLGMPKAFSDSAEFGRLSKEPLAISGVIHQAWVKVAEEGTEAAAATAVIMRYTAIAPQGEPKLFIADHPFLFFIVDDRNGGVLFAGKVMDPRK